MKLFRKVLMSLFPDGFQGGRNGPSPVGMFIGLVSPKQFFSLIHRKIIENYKLNQFDTNLDSFEVKIGFGQMKKLTKKQIDNYFAYNATANMNGWTFFAPSSVATVTTIITAKTLSPILKNYSYTYALALFEAIVVLCYTFAARVKVIDLSHRDDTLRWTVDVLFSTMKSMDEELDEAIIDEIKDLVLQEMQVFVFLMYSFGHLNTLLDESGGESMETLKYILGDENIQVLSGSAKHALYTEMQTRSGQAFFDEIDDEILGNILPSDSLIISLLNDSERYLIADHFFDAFVASEILDEYLTQLPSSPRIWREIMIQFFDYSHLKKNAHGAIKALSRSKFGHTKSYETEKEIDTFMSTVEEKGSLEGMKIPKSIREESQLMDKILNFYIGYVGGLFVARGDSFAMRLFDRDWLHAMSDQVTMTPKSHDALYYYGGLLYHYSKNLYYYQYAFENIKAGNDMFHLPLQSKSQHIYTNEILIQKLWSTALPTLFQDLQKKTLTITVSNETILNEFRTCVGPSLQSILARPRELIDLVYGSVFGMCEGGSRLRSLTQDYRGDTTALKENLYTLDFWVWWDAVETIAESETITQVYDTASIISHCAMLRDTWTGRLIFISAVQKSDASQEAIDALWTIYVVDVLNLSQQFVGIHKAVGKQIQLKYGVLIRMYTKLDDTPGHLQLGISSRDEYFQTLTTQQAQTMVTGEDIVWFRSYLKTLQYYTKRYLKPKL